MNNAAWSNDGHNHQQNKGLELDVNLQLGHRTTTAMRREAKTECRWTEEGLLPFGIFIIVLEQPYKQQSFVE